MSIAAVLLIAVVLILRTIFLKRVPKWTICILWMLVGARLLIPFSLESDFSLIPSVSIEYTGEHNEEKGSVGGFDDLITENSDVNEEISLDTAVSFGEVFESSDETESDMDSEELSTDTSQNIILRPDESLDNSGAGGYISDEPVVSETFGNTDITEKNEITNSPEKEKNGIAVPKKITDILGILWLSGMAFMLLFGIINYVRLRHRVCVYTLYKDDIRKCEFVDSPFVLGVLRPVVYLPFGLSEKTEEYIIRHEKAHIKRFDHISKIIAFVALSIHWFNPLVWVSFVLFCKDIEYACDEKVVRALDKKEKKEYASALLECSINRKSITSFSVAFGEIGVRDRVKNTMSYKKPLFWIIVVFVVLCVVLSLLFLTDPKDESSGEISETSLESSVYVESGEGSDLEEQLSEDETSEASENSEFSAEFESSVESTDDSYEASSEPESSSDISYVNSSETSREIPSEEPSDNSSEDASRDPEDVTPVVAPEGRVLHSGVCGDNLTWKIYQNLVLVISGTGEMYDNYQPWAETNSPILNVVVEKGVTKIGKKAFWGIECIKTVTLPNTLQSIEYEAFGFCTALKTVNIPSSVKVIGQYAFRECKNITNIKIPESVTEIGIEAFSGCDALKTVTLSPYVKSIGNGAFRECTSLKSINIPNSVKSLGYGAFADCTSLSSVKIGNSLKSIERDTFKGCTSLTKVDLGKVERLGTGVFSKCSSLESINIPDSVCYAEGEVFYGTPIYNNRTYWENGALYVGKCLFATKPAIVDANYTVKEGTRLIAGDAFYGSEYLRSITIPSTVVSIGSRAFYNCNYLQSINMPASAKEIGECAFEGCFMLTQAYIGDVEAVGKQIFENCERLETVVFSDGARAVGDNMFYGCKALSEVDLGKSMKYIGVTAFAGCYSMKNIQIPKTIVSIGEGAFRNCTSIKSVDFGDSLASVGISAFYNCTGLEIVNLGKSIESIGGSAFNGCTALKDISLGDKVTYIGSTAFENTTYLNETSNWDNDLLYIGNYLVLADESKSFGDVTIKDGTTLIACNAFENCKIKGEVTFPDTLKIIGSSAFQSTSIESMVIPSNVLEIGSATLKYSQVKSVVINAQITRLENSVFGTCHKLTSVALPKTLTEIGNYTFSGCESLEEIVIPEGVRSIGESAFKNCISLKSILLPKGLAEIGKGAFESCKALETIIIPDSVEALPYGVFYDCSALSSVVLGKSIVNLGGYAFYRCPSLKNIIVHEGVIVIEDKSLGANPSGFYKDFTITGKKGSEAEKYAKANKITFVAQ